MGWLEFIGDVVGDVLGTNTSKDIAEQNMNTAKKANEIEMQIANKNLELQKEFAQHGIRWKVEDAKAAGLHPLAALGAQTSSFSPISVGIHTADAVPKNDFRQSLHSLGQNLDRALNATKTPLERKMEQLRLQQMEEEVKSITLTNSIKAKQLQELGDNPGMPETDAGAVVIDGQGDTSINKMKPNVNIQDVRGIQAGSQPMHQFTVDERGRGELALSTAMEEAAESDPTLQAKMIGRKVWDIAKDSYGWLTEYRGTKGGAEHRQILYSIKNAIDKRLPNHLEYRLNPFTGSWIIKKKGAGERLYLYLPPGPRWKSSRRQIK